MRNLANIILNRSLIFIIHDKNETISTLKPKINDDKSPEKNDNY
jgi:hypothetical protein